MNNNIIAFPVKRNFATTIDSNLLIQMAMILNTKITGCKILRGDALCQICKESTGIVVTLSDLYRYIILEGDGNITLNVLRTLRTDKNVKTRVEISDILLRLSCGVNTMEQEKEFISKFPELKMVYSSMERVFLQHMGEKYSL